MDPELNLEEEVVEETEETGDLDVNAEGLLQIEEGLAGLKSQHEAGEITFDELLTELISMAGGLQAGDDEEVEVTEDIGGPLGGLGGGDFPLPDPE